jgi:hypothetical protein
VQAAAVCTLKQGYHFGELRLGEQTSPRSTDKDSPRPTDTKTPRSDRCGFCAGAGKWNVYDTDLRVPMRISGPGIAAGSTLGLVGSHVDLAPTWLGLAGLETPADMDGERALSCLMMRFHLG